MTASIIPAFAPTLAVVDGKATTLSTDVARHFGKRHDDVLKSIRALASEMDEEHARNFAEMLVDVEIGNGATRQSPAYRLTRDGFTLLAMGFTGKRALQFKLAYIDAFNRMEAQLSAGGACTNLAQAQQHLHAALAGQRFIVRLGDGLRLTPVPDNACVLPAAQWAKAIEAGDVCLAPEELAQLHAVVSQQINHSYLRLHRQRKPPSAPSTVA